MTDNRDAPHACPQISVILPTLRAEAAYRCINRIAATSAGVEYEVVVVSPLDMLELLTGCSGYERIRFVREGAKEGSCKANTLGYLNASGKYIFAIADDHLLGADCLKALIAFMEHHDHEVFLAGARCYGVHGPGLEHTAYGLYYPYTPCIRRDLVEEVGGFYDPYYRCYWGDPDLAMRVWHHGGRAELCLDAWVEFHNAEDEVDSESSNQYAHRDYRAFVERWHGLYGSGAASDKFEDINVCNKRIRPGIPPEKCTRVVSMLRQVNWRGLRRQLRGHEEDFINRQYLPETFIYAMRRRKLFCVGLRRELADWFSRQVAGVPANFNAGDPAGTWEGAFGSIAIFLLTTPLTESAPILVAEGVVSYNLIRYAGNYYAWLQSKGGFSFDRFTSSECADLCKPSVWELIRYISERYPEQHCPDWRKVQAIEQGLQKCAPIEDTDRVGTIEYVPHEVRDELAAWIVVALCGKHEAKSRLRRLVGYIGVSLRTSAFRLSRVLVGDRRSEGFWRTSR